MTCTRPYTEPETADTEPAPALSPAELWLTGTETVSLRGVDAAQALIMLAAKVASIGAHIEMQVYLQPVEGEESAKVVVVDAIAAALGTYAAPVDLGDG